MTLLMVVLGSIVGGNLMIAVIKQFGFPIAATLWLLVMLCIRAGHS